MTAHRWWRFGSWLLPERSIRAVHVYDGTRMGLESEQVEVHIAGGPVNGEQGQVWNLEFPASECRPFLDHFRPPTRRDLVASLGHQAHLRGGEVARLQEELAAVQARLKDATACLAAEERENRVLSAENARLRQRLSDLEGAGCRNGN